MTVRRAIAIWKYKSEVHGLSRVLDNNYRDVVVRSMVEVLRKQVKNNKLLTLMSIQEYSCYQKALLDKQSMMRTANGIGVSGKIKG